VAASLELRNSHLICPVGQATRAGSKGEPYHLKSLTQRPERAVHRSRIFEGGSTLPLHRHGSPPTS
jgi:hypothetical protein